jgi:hypothetical protein
MEILGIILAISFFGLFIYRYIQIKKYGIPLKDFIAFKKYPLFKELKEIPGPNKLEELSDRLSKKGF